MLLGWVPRAVVAYRSSVSPQGGVVNDWDTNAPCPDRAQQQFDWSEDLPAGRRPAHDRCLRLPKNELVSVITKSPSTAIHKITTIILRASYIPLRCKRRSTLHFRLFNYLRLLDLRFTVSTRHHPVAHFLHFPSMPSLDRVVHFHGCTVKLIHSLLCALSV